MGTFASYGGVLSLKSSKTLVPPEIMGAVLKIKKMLSRNLKENVVIENWFQAWLGVTSTKKPAKFVNLSQREWVVRVMYADGFGIEVMVIIYFLIFRKLYFE